MNERIAALETNLLRPLYLDSLGCKRIALAERMKLFETPGISIAVINEGRLEWAHAWGLKEAGTDRLVTTDTLFQAASISKPVTAVGVLRLVGQGLLDLDADVNLYLRSWKVPANGEWQPRITLRQLLSHSAGTTVHGFPGYREDQRIPDTVEVLEGLDWVNTGPVRVNALPGAQFRYSGGGTTIVQLVMTDVTGKAFPDLMRELVFEPLGMTNSTFAQPLPEAYRDRAAVGHRADGEPLGSKWHVYPEMAAAGLWTTPTDLSLLVLELQRIRRGEGATFLSKALVDEMFTPQNGTHYGLGFALEGAPERLRFMHGGDNEGYKCMLIAHADRGQAIVAMTNGDMGYALYDEVFYGLADLYGWPTDPDYFWLGKRGEVTPPDRVDYARYVGTYEARPGFQVSVAAAQEGLAITVTGQQPFMVRPTAEHRFAARNLNGDLTFTLSETGEVTGLSYSGLTAKRIQ